LSNFHRDVPVENGLPGVGYIRESIRMSQFWKFDKHESMYLLFDGKVSLKSVFGRIFEGTKHRIISFYGIHRTENGR